MFILNNIGIVAAIVLIALTMIVLLKAYVKAPPDTAFIISGLRKEPRMLVGSGGFVIPFLERVDMLFLGQFSVDIKTGIAVPTNDFINVFVDAVAKVRVGNNIEDVKLAAKNFLNMHTTQIAKSLQDSLEGNMREVIGALSLEAINTNRDAFSDQIMTKAAEDMKKLGIEIISCNIQNISDENNLIKDLGADNTAKIKKNASISRALAERDVAIAQAEAEKQANDARVAAELEIAQKRNELAIKQAELKQQSDVKKADADAAYKIQEQEQLKIVETKAVNVRIAKAEREAELKKQEVLVQQQILDAEIQKKADADKYAVERNAESDLSRRQREAEARLFEEQREAEAKKAKAEAEKYAMEQEAAGIKAKGEAEAFAIRAKGEAEAASAKALGEAEAAAMEKKAEAFKKYNNAAMAQMAIEIMPKVAAEIAKPLGQIDKITIFGGDGVKGLSGNVPAVMAQTFESVKEATGVDLGDMMRANSLEAKTNRNIKVDVNGVDNILDNPMM